MNTSPKKTIRVASDDEPWYNQSLKKLDRKRRREYNKNRRSAKYLTLSQLYKERISRAKKKYKRDMIDDVRCRLTESKVKEYISRLKTRKSTPAGDIPVKIIKEFSRYLCTPLTDIINTSIKQGEWAACYKKEIITPVPKEYPVSQINMLRPISSLLSFNKIQEMAICDMIALDMAGKLDPTQYGNRKRTGIQHYLVRMIN